MPSAPENEALNKTNGLQLDFCKVCCLKNISKVFKLYFLRTYWQGSTTLILWTLWMKRLDPPRRNRKWSVKAKRRTHNSWGVFWWRVYWLFNFCTILVWTLYNFESFWLNKYNFSSHFKFFIQSAVYLLKKFKKILFIFYPGEIVTVSAETRWPRTTISSLRTSVRAGTAHACCQTPTGQ